MRSEELLDKVGIASPQKNTPKLSTDRMYRLKRFHRSLRRDVFCFSEGRGFIGVECRMPSY